MEYLLEKMNSKLKTEEVIKKHEEDFNYVHFRARQTLMLCRGHTTVCCGLQRSNPSFRPSCSIYRQTKPNACLWQAFKNSKDLDAGSAHLQNT